MRTINCAHLIEAADRPVAAYRQIQVRDGRVHGIADIAASDAEPLFALPALVNAHDHGRAGAVQLVRRRRQAARNLAALSGADAVRSIRISRRRRRCRAPRSAASACVMVHLHARAGTDRSADRSRRGGACGARCRRARRLCASPCATAIRWSTGRPSRSWRRCHRTHARKSSSASCARRCRPSESDRAGRRGCGGRGQPDVRRAISARTACSGAATNCSRRSPRRRRAPAGASTCICLETRYQRAWADAELIPTAWSSYLDAIGLLSPRLTLAHCVWARPDELELLAERGVTIAVNTSSNLHLRSGIAPVARMFRRGCRVALGIDGARSTTTTTRCASCGSAHLLHVGTGFKIDGQPRRDAARMAFANGRRSVTNSDDGGAIARRRAGGPFAARLDRDRRRPIARRYRCAGSGAGARHRAAHPRIDRRRPHGGEGRVGSRRRCRRRACRGFEPHAPRHARQGSPGGGIASARARDRKAFRAKSFLLLKSSMRPRFTLCAAAAPEGRRTSAGHSSSRTADARSRRPRRRDQCNRVRRDRQDCRQRCRSSANS